MDTPQASDNYFMERKGVLKLASMLNDYGYMFRETFNGDIGIDGQIEHINEKSKATGRLVAAQVKSGSSYLHDKGEYYTFYPSEKHVNYWSLFPLQVILFVYNPNDDRIYFTDVKFQLSIPDRKAKHIVLDKEKYLSSETVELIFEATGQFSSEYLSIDEVFNMMLRTVCPNPTFNISYLDLFTQGLTNLCRHTYFNMELTMFIADFYNETDFGLGMTDDEHEFLHDYANFLISQHLALIDYSDYLIDWKERQLQPKFIAPLTSRGQKLLEYIKTVEEKYKDKLPPTTLVRERFIQMVIVSHDDQRRFELGKQLRTVVPQN